MKRIAISAVLLLSLAGCGVFGKNDEKRPRTPLLGERVPVLAYESSAEVDPALADIAVAVPPAVANDSWNQPGGNAEKAMGHLALGTNLSRTWSATIEGGGSKARLAASPVVANGTLYVIDTEATVRAFAADTGALRWATTIAVKGDSRSALFGGGVSVEDGKIYATNGLGDVAALDAATGKQLWKVRPAGPLRGAPSIASGQLYVVTQDNQLFALSALDGSTVWNEAGSLENSGIFGVAAPSVAQGTVVAGFSSGELNAYRYENGRVVWQDALSRTSVSTTVASLADIDAGPVIEDGRVYAVGQGGRMVAMELVTGQRLWEINVGGISTPWIAGEWLFVVTDQGRLLCVSRTSGKIRWATQLQHWHNPKKKDRVISWVGPVVAGNRLVLANSEGGLINVALADGKIGTETDVDAPVYLQPVVANNMLYILDSKGRLTAWR